MQIILRHDASAGFFGTRPIIRLATGTLTRTLDAIDPGKVFKDVKGLSLSVTVIRMEEIGGDVAMDSPVEPGPVECHPDTNWLNVEVTYNEINMVLDRVCKDQPGGRSIPASRDYLDTFADQVGAAMDAVMAWCDDNNAWADRNVFTDPWNAVMDDLRAGCLLRPYEFTLSEMMRQTLDGAWALSQAMPIEDEHYDSLAEAYFLLRDVGWQDADYEADPDAEENEFGQPAKIANLSANLGSSPPPDAQHGYSPY